MTEDQQQKRPSLRQEMFSVFGIFVAVFLLFCLVSFSFAKIGPGSALIVPDNWGGKVGFFIALFLVIIGMFPVVGGIFSIIPNSVLGGATIIMFGTVAVAGIKIIASSVINRRGMLIMAISLGTGLGVVFVPQILGKFPDIIQKIFGSAITTGGLTAILLNIVLPRGGVMDERVKDEPEPATV